MPPPKVLSPPREIATPGARFQLRIEAADLARKSTFTRCRSDTFVHPSRSIYRALRGEAQLPLPQEPDGVDTCEDRRWRLDFAITKAANALGMENPVDVTIWLNDERALVRKAFLQIGLR